MHLYFLKILPHVQYCAFFDDSAKDSINSGCNTNCALELSADCPWSRQEVAAHLCCIPSVLISASPTRCAIRFATAKLSLGCSNEKPIVWKTRPSKSFVDWVPRINAGSGPDQVEARRAAAPLPACRKSPLPTALAYRRVDELKLNEK